MKKVDLTKEHRSLSEVLTFARLEAVLIHSASGEDFVLEPADEFDREVAALGAVRRSCPSLTQEQRRLATFLWQRYARNEGCEAAGE